MQPCYLEGVSCIAQLKTRWFPEFQHCTPNIIICCVAIRNKRMTLSFYKNISLFILRKGLNLLYYKRDKDSLSYWLITSSSLDHTILCYLQGFMSSLPNQMYSTEVICELLAPGQPGFSICRLLDSGDWPLQDSARLRLYLTWASAYIISQCLHILTQPCDCFYLFIQVYLVQRNLWLTTHSRVHMQQSTSRAKINVASQEERLQKWKEHFKNMLGNLPEFIDKPIKNNYSRIILDFQMGQFIEEEFNAILKAKSCRPQQNTSWNLDDKEIW